MASLPSMLPNLELGSNAFDSMALTSSEPDGWQQQSWKLVSVPAHEIDSNASPWSKEMLNPAVCVMGKYEEGDYEVAINSDFIPEIEARGCQMNLSYNPTHPDDRQKDIYGSTYATKKARDCWLARVAHTVRSKCQPFAEKVHRDFARANDLHEELERAVLIQNIATSPLAVLGDLTYQLKLLCRWLTNDSETPRVQKLLAQNQEEFLESLLYDLYMPSKYPQRSRRDEAETTSLFRALLHFSGATVDLMHHEFDDEYTIGDNATLLASVLGIIRDKDFEWSDASVVSSILCRPSISPWVRDTTEGWAKKAMSALRIGFPREHLGLPAQILTGLGVGQIEMFEDYLRHIQRIFPMFMENKMLLLVWSLMNPSQLHILREWADSEDGCILYAQLIKNIQGPQAINQLGLIIAALVGYRRLVPDSSDHLDQPANSSYLADLDAYLHGDEVGNTGTIAKHLAFALVRVLRTYGNTYEDLTVFLDCVCDTEPPLLQGLDGLSDEYLSMRIANFKFASQDHESAYNNIVARSTKLKFPKLNKESNLGWIIVQSSGSMIADNSL